MLNLEKIEFEEGFAFTTTFGFNDEWWFKEEDCETFGNCLDHKCWNCEVFEDVWSLTSGVFEDVWSLTSEIGWECSSPHNLNLEFWLVKWEQFSKYCWLLNCCFLGSFNYVNLCKYGIVDYPCGGLCSPSLHLFYRLEQWSLAGVLGLFGRRWYFCFFFLSC